MFVAHAEPMPSVPADGGFSECSLAASQRDGDRCRRRTAAGPLRPGRPYMAMRFEKTRMSLQCLSCGHNTPGWTIHAHS